MRLLRFHAPLLAGVLAILACGTKRTSGDADGDPVRKEVSIIANALADYGVLEGRGVSIGGWSYIFTIYERLAFLGTRGELVALLRHPSPVTRAYAAQAILATHPDALAELYPLLRDRWSVLVVEGCVPWRRSIPALVLREVCDHLPDSPARTSFLAKSAGDTTLAPSVRDAARTCSWHELPELPYGALEPDEEQNARMLQGRYPKSEEWFEGVAATHPYWRMRFYAATASYGPIFRLDPPTPRAAAVLRRLAADEHPRVRACARALLRTPPGSGPSGGACRWPRPEE
ncbi:MAG: hypothetical protein HY905_18960 [Deltaproteobacteria bacterium]|nr:hypothetical protein [Deltaproteobacteria bacterium]